MYYNATVGGTTVNDIAWCVPLYPSAPSPCLSPPGPIPSPRRPQNASQATSPSTRCAAPCPPRLALRH